MSHQTDLWGKTLRRNYSKLGEKLRLSNSFLNALYELHLVGRSDLEMLRDETKTMTTRVNYLLSHILPCRPDSQVPDFLEALKRGDQDFLADDLRTTSTLIFEVVCMSACFDISFVYVSLSVPPFANLPVCPLSISPLGHLQ